MRANNIDLRMKVALICATFYFILLLSSPFLDSFHGRQEKISIISKVSDFHMCDFEVWPSKKYF